MSRKDQEEADRQLLLEDFERLKFYPWLEWMAQAASLPVSDILTVLSHGVTEPLIREFRKDVAGSGARFVQNHRFLGHTPLETACSMFVEDHWRPNQPIPAREILWNKEWGGKRADVFCSTIAYLRYCHTL